MAVTGGKHALLSGRLTFRVLETIRGNRSFLFLLTEKVQFVIDHSPLKYRGSLASERLNDLYDGTDRFNFVMNGCFDPETRSRFKNRRTWVQKLGNALSLYLTLLTKTVAQRLSAWGRLPAKKDN